MRGRRQTRQSPSSSIANESEHEVVMRSWSVSEWEKREVLGEKRESQRGLPGRQNSRQCWGETELPVQAGAGSAVSGALCP